MQLLLPVFGVVAILGVLGWAAKDDDFGKRRFRAGMRQVLFVVALAVIALAAIWVNRKYGNGS